MTAAEPATEPVVEPDDDLDAVLLAHPGVMAALWWSVCPGPGCRTRIEPRHVQGLALVDGAQKWVCRVCLLRLRPEVGRPP